MAARGIWGLDIGQLAIRAVKLEARKVGKGKPVITMTDTFFYELGTVIDDPDYAEKVHTGLAAFAAEKKPTAHTPVVLAVAGTDTLFRSFTIPPVAEGKIREVVSYEARQLIPYPLEEVIWDFQNLGFDEESGEVQIALICCRREIIDDLLRSLDMLGITVADIQTAPLALVNFCQYDFYNDGKMLLLDCGARSTNFVMFDAETFWLRSIPVCGADLTRALMQKFNLSAEDADKLKTGAGSPQQTARVFKTIEPTMRGLIAEVQRSIGFYRSTRREATVDELLLAGNSFLMEGSDQYMADSLGYGARTFDLPQTIELGDDVDPNELASQRQVYGVAAGLALQGLNLATHNCSLLPESRKLAKLIKSKEIYGWLAAALMIIIVLLELMLVSKKDTRYEADLKRIENALNTSQQRYQQYQNKLKEFLPAQKLNDKLIDVAAGRGMILQASNDLYAEFRKFNESQQRRLSLPLPKSSLREYEKAALAGIKGFKPSNERYDKLYAAKKAEFAADFTAVAAAANAADLTKEMDENLQLQILRQIFLRHQRLRRIFLENEVYGVVVAEKIIADDKNIIWRVSPKDQEQYFDQKMNGSNTANSEAAGGALAGGENDLEEKTDAAETSSGKTTRVPVVIIELKGFLVNGGDSGEDLKMFDEFEKLLKNTLRQRGFYLLPDTGIEGGFARLNQIKRNALNLPKIYSPLPKKLRDEDVGEQGAINRSEALTWEPAEEEVRGFIVRLVYDPKLPKIENHEIQKLLNDVKAKVAALNPPPPTNDGATDEPPTDETPKTNAVVTDEATTNETPASEESTEE